MLRAWLQQRLVKFLTAKLRRYERFGWNDMNALRRHIRKGDVLLSQGDQRISAIIRYLTQSPWSHATLYIGDELLLRGGERAEAAREKFGDDAQHLVIDVLPGGVISKPLSHYQPYNLRLCRARLTPEDLKTVIDDGIAALGWQYDVSNLIDLARFYLPAELVPKRFQPRRPRLGSGARSAVICTSLIGSLFERVGYPVNPIVTPPEPVPEARSHRLWPFSRRAGRDHGLFRRRHPTRLAPCDFDRSPYFEIVKFNFLADHDFDYQRIRWEIEGPPGEDGT